MYLAQHLGLHDSDEFKLIEMSSATEVINAFNLKKVDIAALTLDEVVLLTENNDDLCIFLVMDISNGADKLIANKHINTVSELSGKRVGVEKTALGAYFSALILAFANLNDNDVTIIPVTTNNHYAMMQSGDIDAVVTFEPTATQLINDGYRSIFDSSQIPGKIVDVLVTRKNLANKYHDQLEHLTQSHWQALEFINNNLLEASTLMAPRLQISAEDLAQSYDGLTLPNQQQNQTLLNSSLIETTETLQKVMQQQGLVDHSIESEQLITDKFVQ